MAARTRSGSARLDGRGQHLGRAQGVGAGQGVVADQDGLGRPHGQGGPQAGGLAVRGHRDQGHLAPAGGVGQLERHLDAVGVRIVEDELSLSDKVLCPRIEGRRGGRIGDLLHADNDVHGRALLLKTAPSTNRAADPRSERRPRRSAGPRSADRALTPARSGPSGQAHVVGDDRVHAGLGGGLQGGPVVDRPGGDGQSGAGGPGRPGPNDQVDVGVDRRQPRPTAAATASVGSNHEARSRPVARSGWASATASRVSGQKEEITTLDARPAGHHQLGHLPGHRSAGSKPGSPGRFLISMLRARPRHTSSTSAEQRDVRGEIGGGQLGDRARCPRRPGRGGWPGHRPRSAGRPARPRRPPIGGPGGTLRACSPGCPAPDRGSPGGPERRCCHSSPTPPCRSRSGSRNRRSRDGRGPGAPKLLATAWVPLITLVNEP